MLALTWNFDNPKNVIQWIVEQPDTDKGTCLLLYWQMAPGFSKKFANREECESTDKWYLEDYNIIQTLNKTTLQAFTKNNAMLSIRNTTPIKRDTTGPKT